MITGKCVYSGHDIPKAKGMYKVMFDGKVNLFITRKARSLFDNKVKNQKVLWTTSSRYFHKKDAAVHKEKKQIIQLPKIVRGFPQVSKKAVQEIKEHKMNLKTGDNKDFMKQQKVGKNANMKR